LAHAEHGKQKNRRSVADPVSGEHPERSQRVQGNGTITTQDQPPV
jgi:hypothetical protein